MSRGKSAFTAFHAFLALLLTASILRSEISPSMLGVRVVRYGWPLTWLEATTATTPGFRLEYGILWPEFTFDIILYAAISMVATSLLVRAIGGATAPSPKLSLEQRPRVEDLDALRKRLRRLEAENEALSRDLRRFKRKPSRLWGLSLLALGGVSLAAATAYSSLLPAFIGLGLTFWGVLLLYIRPVRYTRSDLLDATVSSTPAALRALIDERGYRGRGIHMPPRTLKELGTGTLVIPRSLEPETAAETNVVEATGPSAVSNPGLVLTPPGLGLARLIRDELGRDLSTAGLGYLAANLPKVIIEDLEMADDIEFEPHGDRVSAKLSRPLLPVHNEDRPELEYLPSALACLLTWATGRPVSIESLSVSQGGERMEAQFRIFEE